MESERMKNKEGEELVSKDGKPLLVNKFEVGDEFVPTRVKVFENNNEESGITNYSILAKVKKGEMYYVLDKEKHEVTLVSKEMTKDEDKFDNEIFVRLTPTQAESVREKIKDGIEITQEVWRVYEYESKQYGKQIGVGIKKDFKKPIDL